MILFLIRKWRSQVYKIGGVRFIFVFYFNFFFSLRFSSFFSLPIFNKKKLKKGKNQSTKQQICLIYNRIHLTLQFN